jgi:formylglycine-generating enzyme required for sulfatase activity
VLVAAALLACPVIAASTSPAATASPAETFRDCTDCPTMVRIPPGRFTMGAPESESLGRKFGWGGPPTEIRLRRGFSLSQTEVTRAQFAAFVAATGYEPDGRCRSIWEKRLPADARPDWRDPLWPDGSRSGDDHPVVCIGFADAEAYLAWLNGKVAGKRRYRLPSEAEWEYAARAGTRTARYWEPPGTPTAPAAAQSVLAVAGADGAGSDVCRHANVGDARYRALFSEFPTFECDDGFAFTSPVRHFAPNPYGLYDMLGNAWEWVADCSTPDFGGHPRDGRAADAATPAADCTKRVMRGAGFPSADWYLRVTTRGGDPVPATRLVVIGLRVAADP